MGLNWKYKDIDFTEDMIGDSYGFVYLITNLENNRKYIGKKLFWFSKTKQIKGKKKKYKVLSDWQTYYGSNDELKKYLESTTNISGDHPVVITKFIENAQEVELDAIANNGKVNNFDYFFLFFFFLDFL